MVIGLAVDFLLADLWGTADNSDEAKVRGLLGEPAHREDDRRTRRGRICKAKGRLYKYRVFSPQNSSSL